MLKPPPAADSDQAADPQKFQGRVLESIFSNPIFQQVVFNTAASELGTMTPAEDDMEPL